MEKEFSLDGLERLRGRYAKEIQEVQSDNTDAPIVYVAKENVISFLSSIRKEEGFEFGFLSDLTAYDDNPPIEEILDYGLGVIRKEKGSHRFIVVYQLLSLQSNERIRVKVKLNDGEECPSVVPLWKAANWLEREIFDLYGIRFTGHPNMKRIMLDDRWVGHPLRKDYPIKKYQRFEDSSPLESFGLSLDESDPTKKYIDDDFEEEGDIFEGSQTLINIGPQHPATHGTLRIACKLSGETVVDSHCEIGYLHRAMEKLGEVKTYHKFIPYTDRLNYCSALQNNVAYVTTVEKLMGIEIPQRNIYIRTMVCEMARIIDHLICVGISAFDLGAMTYFLYGFHQREECYSLIESLCGSRLTTTYTRIGGLSADLPEGFLPRMKKWLDGLEDTLNEMDRLLTNNRIWVDRTKGISSFTADQIISYSMTGPCMRASNINFDLRRDRPYLAYKELEFDVPVAKGGDVYDRYLVRVQEMYESIRILRQIIEKLPSGPIWADDKRIRIPDKSRVHNSMESLIHHFKFFMEGFDVPAGEAYVPMEGPNGEVGFYIVSKGGPKAYRLRIRAPSFFMFQPVPEMVKGENVADVIAAIGSVNIIAGELDR